MVVIGLGKNLLLKSILGHCDIISQLQVVLLVTRDYSLFIARKHFFRGFMEAMLDSWQNIFFYFKAKLNIF